MPLKTIDQNPSVSDEVLFDIVTTNTDGTLMTPYKVNSITIYFVERDYVGDTFSEFEISVQDTTTSFFYKDAVPIKIFGDEDYPAWIGTDVADAFIDLVSTGHFSLEWNPEGQREGDYLICWTWTTVPSGDTLSTLIHFYLSGAASSPAIPSHQTPPDKYATLAERYTPSVFKRMLAGADITPDIINRTNLGIADGFTLLENLAIQIADLQDSNVINEAFLPYLSAFFGWRLKTQDSTLWRRQIKQAIPLYKQKGTITGLKNALAECAIGFKKLTMYWQVVSKYTWQDGWLIDVATIMTQPPFVRLSKMPLLPVDVNYHLYYRAANTASYTELSIGYVTFDIHSVTPETCEYNPDTIVNMVWHGPFALQPGDYLRLVYRIASVSNQTIETYIQALPLADQRDEISVTIPVKNWNVRLIAEDDAMFDSVCPSRHPFEPDVVFGKIRTEFPYSENIFNMHEYNGQKEDSTDPCDIDSSFYDTCSCCRSSKFSVDVDIEDLSSDRISEAEEVIREFVPFHAVLHSINYTGLIDELIIEPIEEIECLMNFDFTEDIVFSQFDFNRVVIDGKSDSLTLKRDMLANATAVASDSDGVGSNESVILYVPGYKFNNYGIATNNLLEILSGADTGNYTVLKNGTDTLDVVTGSPDTIAFPLDTGAIPFRLSNIQYSETGTSIFQDNLNIFVDAEIDFTLYPITNDSAWSIQVLSGPHTGTYPITFVNSDGSLFLSGWTGSSASSLSYRLNSPSAIIFSNNTGQLTLTLRGRVETQLIAESYDVSVQDYVLYSGTQYKIIDIGVPTSIDKFYITGWSGGNVVGTANIEILRRVADTVGFLDYRGMILTTTTNYETTLAVTDASNESPPTLDDNNFIENYVVLIDTTYYQVSDMDNNDIYLTGPPIAWGVAGTTGVSYTIVHFDKLPFTNQDGTFYTSIDRRGEGSLIETSEPMSMGFRVNLLNKINDGKKMDETISTSEELWCEVEYRK